MTGAQIVTRVVANFAVIAILGQFAPGFTVESLRSLMVASLVLSVMASGLVWVVFALLPLTLGLLLLLPVNLGAFYLTAWLVPGFTIDGVGWAVLGTVLLGAINALLTDLLGRWLQPLSLLSSQEQAAMKRAVETLRSEHRAPTPEPKAEDEGTGETVVDTRIEKGGGGERADSARDSGSQSRKP
ncbi:MAG: phage holin family protein [Pseudomonadota bacterium]